MGLQQIDMSIVGYDVAIAVTSRGLNIALAETLVGLEINAAFDDEMQPAPPSSADIVFIGTLAQLTDSSGNPVDIISINVGGNFVNLNLMFAGGSGTSFKAGGSTLTQGDEPWTFLFQLPLQQTPITTTNLPTSIGSELELAVASFPGSNFQTTLLGFDFTKAILLEAQGLNDGTTGLLAEAILSQILPLYLSTITPVLSLGYFALCTDASAPPTAPTSMTFLTSPYQITEEAPSPLDTLLLLFMLGNRSPSQTPYLQNLPFTWVDDLTINGAAAIRGDVAVGALLTGVSGMLATISPTLSADAKADNYAGTLTLNQGQAAAFSPSSTLRAQAPPVGTYTYPTVRAKDSQGNFSSTTVVDGDYGSTCQVVVGSDVAGGQDLTKIFINGTCTFDGSFEYTGDSAIYVIPTSTYNWNVLVEVQSDLVNSGQLDLAVVSSDFSSDPVVTGSKHTTWQKILASLSGTSAIYAGSVTDLGTAISNQVVNEILPALKTSLSAGSPLLFPGGQTFLFSSPQFTSNLDLVANIEFHD